MPTGPTWSLFVVVSDVFSGISIDYVREATNSNATLPLNPEVLFPVGHRLGQHFL